MSKFYKTKGIILKRADLGEADRILTIFTATQGKVKARARGVRKILSKLGGHLELFNLADLSFYSGKGLDIITACQVMECFSHLRSNLRKTSLAYYTTELLDKLTPEKQKDYRIYRLLKEIFRALDNPRLTDTKKLYLVVRSFELKLLNLLGYAPELKKCVACGKLVKPNLYFFSSKLGGLLCAQCKKQDTRSAKISINAIKTIKYLQDKDFNQVTKLKLPNLVFGEVRNIIINFIRYIFQKEPKTRFFVKKIEKLS